MYITLCVTGVLSMTLNCSLLFNLKIDFYDSFIKRNQRCSAVQSQSVVKACRSKSFRSNHVCKSSRTSPSQCMSSRHHQRCRESCRNWRDVYPSSQNTHKSRLHRQVLNQWKPYNFLVILKI